MARLSLAAARRLGLVERRSKKRRVPAARPSGVAADRRPVRFEPLHLEIAGKPVPKQSFRTADAGQQGYTSKRVKNYAKRVSALARLAMGNHQPWACGLEIEMRIAVEPPKSWPKAKRAAALAGEIEPTQRPDLDNLAKNAIDALTGIVAADDSLFTRKLLEKSYAPEAGMKLMVQPRRPPRPESA